jgi:hypothetical protein
VPTAVVSRARLDALALRQLAREYAKTNRCADAQLYAQRGPDRSLQEELARQSRGRRAVYQLGSRRLYVRADVSRRDALQEAVRAVGLRFYGGARAMRAVLTRPPISTAQVFHLDLYLERRAPQGLDRLPDTAAGATLTATHTFGELDVRALFETFAVESAAAEHWSAGLSGVYRLPDGSGAAALLLACEDDEAATAWFTAARSYVAAAFPAPLPLPVARRRVGVPRAAPLPSA